MKTKLLAAALAASFAAAPAAAKETPITLETGYRSVAVPAPKHQVAPLKAGDRVDVLTVIEIKNAEGKQEKVTATIFQNVLVLGADPILDSVQLALNPNEAQYAALSVDSGQKLWLPKRAKGDVDMHPMEMAAFRKLFR